MESQIPRAWNSGPETSGWGPETQVLKPRVEGLKPRSWDPGPETSRWGPETQVLRAKYRGSETQVLTGKRKMTVDAEKSDGKKIRRL
jgi:hypothetical protein